MTFDNAILENIPHTVKHYPAKSTLLSVGDCAKYLFLIKSGAVRICFNKDGKDCTLQFFLDGEPVCIYESFVHDTPSLFTIETIEPTEMLVFHKDDLLKYVELSPIFKETIIKYLLDKMTKYVYLFLSMQTQTPEQRYVELVKHHPNIIQRVPQYYIASFLGITSVSLSRIRSRKSWGNDTKGSEKN